MNPTLSDQQPSKGSSSKKPRKVFMPHQLSALEEYYILDQFPKRGIREEIASRLSLSPHSIQVWFQNKRAKDRRRREKLQERSIKKYTPKPPPFWPVNLPFDSKITDILNPTGSSTVPSSSSITPSDLTTKSTLRNDNNPASPDSEAYYVQSISQTSPYETAHQSSSLRECGAFTPLKYISEEVGEYRFSEDRDIVRGLDSTNCCSISEQGNVSENVFYKRGQSESLLLLDVNPCRATLDTCTEPPDPCKATLDICVETPDSCSSTETPNPYIATPRPCSSTLNTEPPNPDTCRGSTSNSNPDAPCNLDGFLSKVSAGLPPVRTNQSFGSVDSQCSIDAARDSRTPNSMPYTQKLNNYYYMETPWTDSDLDAQRHHQHQQQQQQLQQQQLLLLQQQQQQPDQEFFHQREQDTAITWSHGDLDAHHHNQQFLEPSKDATLTNDGLDAHHHPHHHNELFFKHDIGISQAGGADLDLYYHHVLNQQPEHDIETAQTDDGHMHPEQPSFHSHTPASNVIIPLQSNLPFTEYPSPHQEENRELFPASSGSA